MDEASGYGPSTSRSSNGIGTNSKARIKIDPFLQVRVQDQKEPLFLSFDADRNVSWKELRAKLPNAGSVFLKKNGETYICKVLHGIILQPAIGWDGGRAWVSVNSNEKVISLKRKRVLARLFPAEQLPSQFDSILERFNVDTWEELYSTPRFSAPFHSNMAKFVLYRNAVIQWFTQIIIRLGPEGFDLYTMFRISEGDMRVCEVLKTQLAGCDTCSCCRQSFNNELEALQHYFDLEHGYQSGKMFDEPVYVSSILETAREHKMFLPLQEFGTYDEDGSSESSSSPLYEPVSTKKKKSRHNSTASKTSSSKDNERSDLRRVKAELVEVISPPMSPNTNSNSSAKQDLPSFSTPSPVDEPMEAEVAQEPSPLPPPQPELNLFVRQTVHEQQRTPTFRLGYDGVIVPVVQPSPAIPVSQLNQAASSNTRYNANNVYHAPIDTTVPPPTFGALSTASETPGPSSSVPRRSRWTTEDSSNELVSTMAHPPELPRSHRNRLQSETSSVTTAKPSKRGNQKNPNLEPLPPIRKVPVAASSSNEVAFTMTHQSELSQSHRNRHQSEASNPARPSKRANPKNPNLEPLLSNLKVPRAVPATSSPTALSSRKSKNANLEPIAPISKGPVFAAQARNQRIVFSTDESSDDEPTPPPQPTRSAPPVRLALPAQPKRTVFSSDSEDEQPSAPPPEQVSRPVWKMVSSSSTSSSEDEAPPAPPPKSVSRAVWRKVSSSSSSSSSDNEDPTVPYRQHLKKEPPSKPAKPASKPAATPLKSPAPPPAKKARMSSTSTATTTPEPKKKPATKSKRKSTDPPPVVDMASDSEARRSNTAGTSSSLQGRQPTMRPEMVPYIDFYPEYKCDLTTPVVSMEALLEHFKVSSEAALCKLPAFQVPKEFLNDLSLPEFAGYRSFLIRNARSFCIKQRDDFPFVFHMFKATKSETVHLADIDHSYALTCKKCDNMPLTLDHLFSRGHIMMFSKSRMDELQIGLNYIRRQLKSFTSTNQEYDDDRLNPTFCQLLNMYKVPTIDALCLKPNFCSTLLPEDELYQFQTKIIQAIVNTNFPQLPFIKLPTFSIDKLIYLRDNITSHQLLRDHPSLKGRFKCSCGTVFQGCDYVVHVLTEFHLNIAAFDVLKLLMEDMIQTETKFRFDGTPIHGYTTIADLSECAKVDLTNILQRYRRYEARNVRGPSVASKITAIENELSRRKNRQ